MDRAVDAVNLGTAGGSLSLWGLFMQAELLVKLVMLGLLGASVWVWAVVFEKWSSLRRVNKEADGFEDRFWSGGSRPARIPPRWRDGLLGMLRDAEPAA